MNPTKPQRYHFRALLRLITMAPLTHGAGAEGGEQILRTERIQVGGVTGYLADVPVVSGAAVRGALRNVAVTRELAAAGITDDVSLDALRLLFKGGKLTTGGTTVPIEEIRRLRRILPCMSLFGCMDDAAAFAGKLKVSNGWLVCHETAESGIVAQRERVGDVVIETWPDIEEANGTKRNLPVAAGLRSTTTYYRHDVRALASAREMLTAADREAGEEQRLIVGTTKALGGKSDKDARREANESMPHAYQTIIPGAELRVELRLEHATDREIAALSDTVAAWAEGGGFLGGASAKGHGRTRVEVLGSERRALDSGGLTASGAVDWQAVSLAHLDSHREQLKADGPEIRAFLGAR